MTVRGHAAGLFVLVDPDWRSNLNRAGWTLLIPFVGWYAILGYRLALAERLLHGPDRLPEWKGKTWRYAIDGVRAAAVIGAYLSPWYALTAWLATQRGWTPHLVPREALVVGVVFPFLWPVSLPLGLLALTWAGYLRPLEGAALGLGFAVTVFVIPAAFLQVSRTSRFRSALALTRVASFLRRRMALYARAWRDGLPLAIAGHAALPVWPWGVAWVYGSTVFLFNAVLVVGGDEGRDGWIARALGDPRWHPVDPANPTTIVDGGGERVRVWRGRWFSVPVPFGGERSRS